MYPSKTVLASLENIPRRGIVSLLIGGLLLTAHDAAVKSVPDIVPIGQLIAVRGIMATFLLTILISLKYGWREAGTLNFRGNIVRAILMIISTFLFITGLRLMPLADAVAIAFVGPIMLTALAASVLGEDVGWRRWTAVGLGFCGVIIMLRPSGEGIYWVALFPVGAALAGSIRDIVTRQISVGDSSITILFFTTAAVAASGIITLPFVGWMPLDIERIGLLGLISLLYCSAHFFIIEAFRYAEAGLLSTFRYFSLVWATIFGFIFWHHLPDLQTIVGSMLVVGAGVYIAWREVRLKNRSVRAVDG